MFKKDKLELKSLKRKVTDLEIQVTNLLRERAIAKFKANPPKTIKAEVRKKPEYSFEVTRLFWYNGIEFEIESSNIFDVRYRTIFRDEDSWILELMPQTKTVEAINQ